MLFLRVAPPTFPSAPLALGLAPHEYGPYHNVWPEAIVVVVDM